MIGEGSHVVVDGESHPLDIPSGMQSGLKIIHPFTVIADGLFEATIDFDAQRSVHQTGMGQYKLMPVIRMVENHLAGSIHGIVVPSAAVVMTMVGTDTVQTYPHPATGAFHLPMLPAGLYDVTLQPLVDAYVDSVITDVDVVAGQSTDLGLIELPTP